MPYIDRDPQGRFVGIFAVAQREGQEFVEGEVELTPPDPFPGLKPALDVELTARRDKLMTVCNGLALQFLARNEQEHFALALHLVNALKDVSPKHPAMESPGTERQYRDTARALYLQAVAAAVATTWPDDPDHAVPAEVKIEFERYMA